MKRVRTIKRFAYTSLVICGVLCAWPCAVLYRHFNGGYGWPNDVDSILYQVRAGWSLFQADPQIALARFQEICGDDLRIETDEFLVISPRHRDWLDVWDTETGRHILHAESDQTLYSSGLYALLHKIQLKDGVLSWLDEDDDAYLYDCHREIYLIKDGQSVGGSLTGSKEPIVVGGPKSSHASPKGAGSVPEM